MIYDPIQYTAPVTWDWRTYKHLHAEVSAPGYPGYKPDQAEIPNGDGHVDQQKRYAHVAPKYGLPEGSFLRAAWLTAYDQACVAARALKLPPPGPNSTLRVLEYPTGVGGHAHTDFDMFTLRCFRTVEHALCIEAPVAPETHRLRLIRKAWPGIHLGELATEFRGLPADLHYVAPCAAPQFSIVFFAMPYLNLRLQSGVLVRDWLAERYARSRVPA